MTNHPSFLLKPRCIPSCLVLPLLTLEWDRCLRVHGMFDISVYLVFLFFLSLVLVKGRDSLLLTRMHLRRTLSTISSTKYTMTQGRQGGRCKCVHMFCTHSHKRYNLSSVCSLRFSVSFAVPSCAITDTYNTSTILSTKHIKAPSSYCLWIPFGQVQRDR